MNKTIINLEINEVSPTLISQYIKSNRNCNLAKLLKKEKLNIYTTKALDIEKDKLYPSQTWASFNTGKNYSEHKCYWYSDKLNNKDLIWNNLVSKNISVGILGSLHSSKYPNDLISNKNYKFYLPDCFSNEDKTKPKSFKYFQSLNNTLVGASARVTGLNNLVKTLSSFLFKIFIRPKNFGISFFSLKMISSIIYFTILYQNKEIIRMAQFPLLASIFTDLFTEHKPMYSTLFSNHIAGNMHRYWYAYDINSFKNKKKYPKKWIERNKRLIFLGMDILDNYLGYILNKKEFKDSIILITSSMGQEANPKFDEKFLAKYDGKIKNIDLFLQEFSSFFHKNYGEKIEIISFRNMAPQYGFYIKNQLKQDVNNVVKAIYEFTTNLGFKNKVDENSGSIVLSLDPYTDMNLQEKYNVYQANQRFSRYGFDFFPIDDHHSGSHSEYGSLIAINSSDKFKKIINKYVDKKGWINYLDFYKLITNFFQKK